MKKIYHKHFIKTYSKLSEKLKDKVDERLTLFRGSPLSEVLNNHELKGEFVGHRSININGDYRAIYRQISKDKVLFVKLGTYSELYD